MTILIKFDIPKLHRTHYITALEGDSIESVFPILQKKIHTDIYNCKFKTKTSPSAMLEPAEQFLNCKPEFYSFDPVNGFKLLEIIITFIKEKEVLQNNEQLTPAAKPRLISPDIRPVRNKLLIESKNTENISFESDVFTPRTPILYINKEDDKPQPKKPIPKATIIHQNRAPDPPKHQILINPNQTINQAYSHNHPRYGYTLDDLFDFDSFTNTQTSSTASQDTNSSYYSNNPIYFSNDTLKEKYQSLSKEDKDKVDRLLSKGYSLALVLQVFEACDHDEATTEIMLQSS